MVTHAPESNFETSFRRERRRLVIPNQERATAKWRKVRPGLGLAQRGVGRGAKAVDGQRFLGARLAAPAHRFATGSRRPLSLRVAARITGCVVARLAYVQHMSAPSRLASGLSGWQRIARPWMREALAHLVFLFCFLSFCSSSRTFPASSCKWRRCAAFFRHLACASNG